MGQSAAETVREIERTRARLTEELDELEDRLPDAAIVAKRAARVAAGGGIAGTVLLFVVKRVRKKRKRRDAALRVEPVQVKVDLVPERWGELLADPRAKQWAAGAAGVWIVLRLAELRSLRKLRRRALV